MTKNDITLTLISKKLDELRLEYSENVAYLANHVAKVNDVKQNNIRIAAQIIELEQTALFLKGE